MRFGLLSDLAIKASRPEFFPLDLGMAYDSKPANLVQHPFKGIKHKIKKMNTSRFPMTDLANFATFTAPQLKEQSKFNAVMNYRKEIGSSNYLDNLETAYKRRMTHGEIKTQTEAPTNEQVQVYENSTTQTTSSLQMFNFSKNVGSRQFDQFVPEYKKIFSKRIKSTLANIVEPNEIKDLLGQIYPHELKQKRITDHDVLENLNKLYRNDKDELATIQRAFDFSNGLTDKKIYPQEQQTQTEEQQTEEQEQTEEFNREY